MNDQEREQAISELWTRVWAACDSQDKELALKLWTDLRSLMQGRKR